MVFCGNDFQSNRLQAFQECSHLGTLEAIFRQVNTRRLADDRTPARQPVSHLLAVVEKRLTIPLLQITSSSQSAGRRCTQSETSDASTSHGMRNPIAITISNNAVELCMGLAM